MARIDGTTGDDLIIGTDSDDDLFGYPRDGQNGPSGGDTLKGGGGEDLAVGGDRKDRLYGGGGGDSLRGNDGDDRLVGARGRDELIGGNGDDRFVYRDPTDSSTGASDLIMDFEQGRDAIVFKGQAQGSDGDLAFIGAAQFSHTPGEIRYVASDARTEVYVDLDGDARIDIRITLDFPFGRHDLTRADFDF